MPSNLSSNQHYLSVWPFVAFQWRPSQCATTLAAEIGTNFAPCISDFGLRYFKQCFDFVPLIPHVLAGTSGAPSVPRNDQCSGTATIALPRQLQLRLRASIMLFRILMTRRWQLPKPWCCGDTDHWCSRQHSNAGWTNSTIQLGAWYLESGHSPRQRYKFRC